MAAVISEEVRAIFTGDTSDLKRKADESKRIVTDAKRAFSARTAAGEIKNTILNPQLLADKGLDKLIGKMKLSALAGGAAAAGFQVLGTAIEGVRDRALAASQETNVLNESVRRLANANTFTSASEGVASLAGRLTALREKATELNQENSNLHPVGFADRLAMLNRLQQTYGYSNAQDGLRAELQANKNGRRIVGQETTRIQAEIPESLRRQLDLTRDRLQFDQQTVQVKELQLQKEREINDLRASGASTPENERLTNERYDAEIQAQEDLRDAMQARYRTEIEIRDLKLSSLSADQQSVASAERRVTQIQKELQTRRYINTEEGRQLEAELQDNQNTVRLAQRTAALESPGARNRRFYNQQRREGRNRRADARIDATDGLINIQRDFSGRITGGTDIVTGQRRAVSPGFVQQAGLQTGTLGPSFVRASFGQNRFIGNSLPGLSSLKDTGHDTDTGHGRTLIAAQNKLIDAADVSNAYLKQMQMDISILAANSGYA